MSGSRRLPILTFHSLDDQSSPISFPAALFRRGLMRLRQAGYETIGLLEAADLVRRQQAFPERRLVITFDDGYRNTYDAAFRVLADTGMSATVFLTVGPGDHRDTTRLPSLNGRDMLSWAEVREMHQSRHVQFGAHTLTHPDLTTLDVEALDREVADSKNTLELALGERVSSFAYPFGRYDRRAHDTARRHFQCACSDRLGLVTSASDVFALERVDAYYLRADWAFALVLRESFPWYVWARSVPRRIRRAIGARGGRGSRPSLRR